MNPARIRGDLQIHKKIVFHGGRIIVISEVLGDFAEREDSRKAQRW